MQDMRTWQAADDIFSKVAGAGSAFRGRIAEGPQPERLAVQHFTEDYLSMHGISPMIGRDFTREDCDPGAPLVALLGYGYWRSHFGGRRDVVGETIRLDADAATIVGVLPAWFDATTPVALPLRIPASEFTRRGTGRVSVYARLLPGVTIEQAAAKLSARTVPSASPAMRDVRASVRSRLDAAVSRYRTTVNVFAGAVALILLIASVNVAGLLGAPRGSRSSPSAPRSAPAVRG
jgi:hypothetical protein